MRRCPCCLHVRGFILLEIIVSIALFSLVATSMVVALHRLAETSSSNRKDAAIYRRFDSVITEVAYRPGVQLQPGVKNLPADGSGVIVKVEIIPEKYTNQEGASLDSMYRIRLTGHLEHDTTLVRSTERLIYSPPPTQLQLQAR